MCQPRQKESAKVESCTDLAAQTLLESPQRGLQFAFTKRRTKVKCGEPVRKPYGKGEDLVHSHSCSGMTKYCFP